MKVWQCSVCKYIHRGDTPPDKCPVCGVDGSQFIEIDETAIPGEKIVGKAPEKSAGPSASVRVDPDPPKKTLLPQVPEKGIEKIKSLAVKHHVHPISVHTPNGILPVAVVLWILAWILNAELPAKAAMINMIFVVLSFPVVIFTGILEWQRKYQGALTWIFKVKILAAVLTTVSCLISLAWYILDPGILTQPKAWAFILINLIMLASAGIAGYIGGKLVFKD